MNTLFQQWLDGSYTPSSTELELFQKFNTAESFTEKAQIARSNPGLFSCSKIEFVSAEEALLM